MFNWVKILSFVSIIIFLQPALALASFDEGIDYQNITPPVKTYTPHKVQVVELFWYGCPHCYHFEPILLSWLKHKPKDVVFKRIPAILQDNSDWSLDARAFYAAQTLGILKKTHEALFNAIHKYHKPLYTAKALAAFYAHYGVSASTFLKTMYSFAVDMKIKQADKLTQEYQIHGVPSLVVNGKYLTYATLAGSEERMVRVLNYLVKKEVAALHPAAVKRHK